MTMAAEVPPDGWLARPVNVLLAPHLEALSARLSRTEGLTAAEREVVDLAAREHLGSSAQHKLYRVLLLELQTAEMEEQLDAVDPPGRWARLIDRVCTPDFHAHLRRRYPPLLDRLATVGRLQSQAVLRFVDRFIADREALASLPGHPRGALKRLRLGEGEPHRGGQTVALLELEAGSVLYKPRCLRVDRALDGMLERLLLRVRLPWAG